VANVSNGGTIDVGSPGLTITGNVANSGTLNAAGPLSMPGSVANSGTINIVVGFTIGGNLDNTGTLHYGGAFLQTLTVNGNYTQTGSGRLEMRLDNGGVSDWLSVGGNATAAGTLQVTAVGALAPNQNWGIIASANIVTNFTTKIFPNDGNPFWMEVAGAVSN
jgi:hypothetical protein